MTQDYWDILHEIIIASKNFKVGQKKLMHWRSQKNNRNLKKTEERQIINNCFLLGFKVENMAGCKLLTKI